MRRSFAVVALALCLGVALGHAQTSQDYQAWLDSVRLSQKALEEGEMCTVAGIARRPPGSFLQRDGTWYECVQVFSEYLKPHGVAWVKSEPRRPQLPAANQDPR